jgi:hypothetical protein
MIMPFPFVALAIERVALNAIRRVLSAVNPSIPSEPKMPSDIWTYDAESRTTLDLDPIIGAEAWAKNQWPVAVLEKFGVAFVMIPEIGDYIAVPFASQIEAWQKDGTPIEARCKLLAWRTWTGPWHVLDSRVSTLLAQVDAEIEP